MSCPEQRLRSPVCDVSRHVLKFSHTGTWTGSLCRCVLLVCARVRIWTSTSEPRYSSTLDMLSGAVPIADSMPRRPGPKTLQASCLRPCPCWWRRAWIRKSRGCNKTGASHSRKHDRARMRMLMRTLEQLDVIYRCFGNFMSGESSRKACPSDWEPSRVMSVTQCW